MSKLQFYILSSIWTKTNQKPKHNQNLAQRLRFYSESVLQYCFPGEVLIYWLEGMMLKLKLQYFSHLMRRADSLEKTDAGRDWGQEEKGTTEDEMAGWHHGLDGRQFEWTLGLVMDREAGRAAIHRVAKSQTRLSDWTEPIQSNRQSKEIKGIQIG